MTSNGPEIASVGGPRGGPAGAFADAVFADSKRATTSPTADELRALRALVHAAGETEALRVLGLHREHLARMLAGLGVRAGTVYQVRARLSDLMKTEGLGQP